MSLGRVVTALSPDVEAGKIKFPGKKLTGILGAPASSYSGTYTFTEQHPVPSGALAYRLVWRNYSGSAAMALAIAKTAPAATSGNNGTALTWSTVTVGGAGAGSVPQALGSSGTIQPGILYSDWIYGIVSTPYVQTRSVFGSGNLRTIVAADLNALNSDTGELILSAATSGDHATVIDSQTPATGSPSYHTCDLEWIIDPAVRCYTVLDVGDSRSRGEYSTSGRLGPSVWARSLAKSSGRFLLGAANYGVSSAPRSASHAQLLKALPIIVPTFACIWFESPNDGNGQAPNDADFALGVQAVSACQSSGVTPIVCTPTPRNLSSANLTIWLAQVQRVRNYAQKNGLLMADYAAVLEDPANPGQWISAYKASGDASNFHASQAGYKAQGAELYRVISEAVG
jgi:hypothetical protein